MKRILTLLYCLLPMLLFAQGTLSTLKDMHSVVKGETWESIAEGHGISVLDLQAANPDVVARKLKKGTLLILPRKTLPSQYVPVTEVPAKPEPVIRTSIPDLKVGVLLPLSEGNMVEFYRGLLMAADSVRKTGVNLDIHAWDSGTTASQIEPLLPKFDGLDILFGPKEVTQIPLVAEACKQQGTRLVLPFWSGQPLFDYPLVYNATAPGTTLFQAAVDKLMSFYPDKNYVIVQSGKDDSQGKILSQTLIAALAGRSIAPRTLAIEGDDFAYETAFNQFRENMIVLDDSSIPSLDTLLSHLKAFRQKHPQYPLSLLGYADWQEDTEERLDHLFAHDTYIISPYYYNVLDNRIKRFERTYARNFRAYIAANKPRYAALGYDIGLYFLGGVSRLGDTFEQMQSSIQQAPYQNWFHFERTATSLSLTNNFVQFIHYTPDSKVELIR